MRALPPKIGLATLIDGAVHPSWTWNFLRSEPIRFANVSGTDTGDGTEAVALADYINSQLDPTMTWTDVEWLRSHRRGPVVLKGIQVPDDAEIAAKEGVDAIAVSNHGGRQLDDAPSPIAMLPSIVDVVAGRSAIICDGGVRRGSDAVKACALGANACMAGRAYLYGLAVAGERGVAHVLEMWRRDIARTLALCGVTSIAELTPDVIARSR